jgi:hypothetical protein
VPHVSLAGFEVTVSDLVAVAVYQRRNHPEAARFSAKVTQFTVDHRFAAFYRR